MTTAATSALVIFRRVTGFALIGIAPLMLAAQAAFAQSEPAYQNVAPVRQSTDPPGRVARLNYMAGTVTTEPAGQNDWSYASINRPLTTGDRLWNDANARSEVHIGSTAVRLGSSTSLDVMNLDDTNAQLKVAQGTLSTRVRSVPPGSTYEIDTPNVALGVTRPGDYRVDVAPDGSTTTVTVRSGALTAYGENGQVPVESGQQITFTGTNLQEASVAEAPAPDPFDQWANNRDAAEDRSVSARYVSRDIPGYEDLDANGTWSDDPQYGAIWVPNQEPAGWAPYHDGHWAWIAPWGWTWIDDAPWGFAPYHYGRWAYLRSSWCWVPGPLVVSAPPVYAPALVAFVGSSDGWSVSLSIGGAPTPGLAWFPLGPGEVWHPGWGGWSPSYYQRVNQTVIVNRNVNITNIHNTYINYRAPGAVTAVPATAFVHGKAVAHFAQRVDPRQWGNKVRINPGAAGVAPVRDSRASGLRAATYHPPGTLSSRPVVATRAPSTPPAYRDRLAQHLAQAGAAVPGAGRPAVRPVAPAPFAGQSPRGVRGGPQAMPHDVRVVGTHTPVITPRHTAANAGPRPGEAGQHGGPPRTDAVSGQPSPHQPGFGEPRAAPQVPAAIQRPQPNNGVPRPPEIGSRATQGAETGARPAPAWTRPHAPVTQQRLPMNEPHATAGGAPGQGGAMQHGEPPRPSQSEMRQPQAAGPGPSMQERGGQVAPRVEQSRAQQLSQPRMEQSRQQPQPQPHVEQPRPQPQPQPHFEQPRPQAQPHFEQPRPQPQPQQPHFEQPRPQPQPQPHFEQPRPQPQPQPHFEQPRPQPQSQPHFEQPRPQPQPQPHFEQPRPQPQPQPHFEQPHPQPQPHFEQPRPQPAPQQHPQQHAAGPSEPAPAHHRG